MEKTIFQKIIEREVPAHIVYEDDSTLAFLDVRPTTPYHTLVITKEPYKDILDATEEAFGGLLKVVHRVAREVKRVSKADGLNIIHNCGTAAGQDVFHIHIHIIPRYKNDGVFKPPVHLGCGSVETGYQKCTDEDFLKQCKELKEALKDYSRRGSTGSDSLRR